MKNSQNMACFIQRSRAIQNELHILIVLKRLGPVTGSRHAGTHPRPYKSWSRELALLRGAHGQAKSSRDLTLVTKVGERTALFEFNAPEQMPPHDVLSINCRPRNFAHKVVLRALR